MGDHFSAFSFVDRIREYTRRGPRARGFFTIPDGLNLTIPVAAWLELPLGPLHATLDAQLDYRLSDRVGAALASADLAELGVALRLPGDRGYWPKSHAGVGPYLRGAVIDAGGPDPVFVVTLGVELYGSD